MKTDETDKYKLALQDDVPSSRELQVLKAIACGMTTKEIARHLFLSEYTVENHRKALLHKLDAGNTASLLIKAIGAGYLNPYEILKTGK